MTSQSEEQWPGSATWDAQARHWYETAVALREDGRPHMAADLLSRVLLIEPASAFLREEVATTQFAAAQYVGARVTFSAMVAVDSKDDYAYYGLGMAQARLGELGAAQRSLIEAVVRVPGNESYRAALHAVQTALADGHPLCAPPTLSDEGVLMPPDIPPCVGELELAPRRSNGGRA